MTANKRSRFTLRIPKELNSNLDFISNKLGISKNALILQILWKENSKEKEDKEWN